MSMTNEATKDLCSKPISQVYRPPQGIGQSLKSLYPEARIFTYSLARFALKEILDLLRDKRKLKILVPEFICRHLLASMVDDEVIYYPVNKNLALDHTHELPMADVIIAVNYFGFAQDLKVFKDYCEKSDAILIEDNAHGFLSRDENGQALGTRGDFGLTCVHKTLPTPHGGGVLLVNQSDFFSRLESITQTPVLKAADRRHEVKMLLRNLTPVVRPKGWQLFTRGLRKARLLVKGSEIPLGEDRDELIIPGDKNPGDIDKILKNTDIEEEIARRRALYHFLAKELEVEAVFKDLPAGTCPMGFAFFLEHSQEFKIQRKLFELGLEFYYWPSLPAEIVKKPHSFYDKVACVRFLW